ncbi:MAG TPA: DUF4839 domain-containing protein [Candidatus Limnocylindrales bacterium]|nr:DUF4839 domain-containing protein [Candidatus Limnocylindrales bacterium]
MSIAPPGYTTDEPDPGSGSPPADDRVQYEFKSVQALRGRASSAKTKWQNQGWELVSEYQGTLRTDLTFRRVKPKTLGSHLLSMVATVQRPQPKTRSVLFASGALILVAGILAIAVGTQSGGESPKPSAAQTTAPAATPSSGPDNYEQVLTTGNSPQVAALMKVSDYCDGTIAPVAGEIGGKTIEFDGSIADMANHGDYDTRYDILIAPGDKGPDSTVGPSFKFEDVNVFDLNFTGAAPSAVGVGDRFRFVAQVVKYDQDQCLLFLAPVSTSVR